MIINNRKSSGKSEVKLPRSQAALNPSRAAEVTPGAAGHADAGEVAVRSGPAAGPGGRGGRGGNCDKNWRTKRPQPCRALWPTCGDQHPAPGPPPRAVGGGEGALLLRVGRLWASPELGSLIDSQTPEPLTLAGCHVGSGGHRWMGTRRWQGCWDPEGAWTGWVGVGGRGMGRRTCRGGRVAPQPLRSGEPRWPGPGGRGEALAKITSDKESKGHGNNLSLSLWVTWQEVLELTEGVGPSRAAQDKQGGRKFPRSQGRRLEPS